MALKSEVEEVSEGAHDGQTATTTSDLNLAGGRAEYLAHVAAYRVPVEKLVAALNAEECERLRAVVAQLRHRAGGLGDGCDLFSDGDVSDWDMLATLEDHKFVEIVGGFASLRPVEGEMTTIYRRIGPANGDALWEALTTRLGIEPEATYLGPSF